MNRSAMAVCYPFRTAGIPRRQCCNPNWVRDYPRVPVECAWCGQTVMVRQYYQRNGSAGSNSNPKSCAHFHPASAGHAGISAQ